jgi:3-oxoadipate enol-lactonase
MKFLEKAMLPKLLTVDSILGRGPLVALVRDMILNNPPEGAIAALQAMAERRDQRDLLPDIEVPALVLNGAEDQVIPVSVAEALAEALPDAECVIVPAAGHLVPMEQPEATNQALLAWLRRL